jgi:hypothetical protein
MRDIARRECTGDNVASRNQRGRTCKMRPRIGPEGNNGIGGRGLNQKLQGRIGIKDPHAKLQLRLRIEQMSDGIDVKIFRLENEKPQAESFMPLRKMDLVEGSTTAEMEETADKEGAGHVESLAPTVGERERQFFK